MTATTPIIAIGIVNMAITHNGILSAPLDGEVKALTKAQRSQVPNIAHTIKIAPAMMVNIPAVLAAFTFSRVFTDSVI
jgi:hypothetical protein